MGYRFKQIASRIEQFRIFLKMKRGDFANAIGIDNNNYKVFLKALSFRRSRLNELYEHGMNINWLISGSGLPFNKTERGLELLKEYSEFEQEKITNNQIKKQKIRNWIIIEYGSLRDFCFQKFLDLNEIDRILSNDMIIEIDILEILSKDGLNLSWVHGIEDNPFNNSNLGREKMYNYLNANNEDYKFSKLNNTKNED